ncbi:MAG: hypothetical protein KGK07_16545, partial [Chloroflexota bacterium]|nr:hypothetical protein [Chloroflexota bacterium]
WRVGQHMSIVGRNGSGKSMLASRLLSQRRWRILIRTKPDDIEYPDALVVSTAAELMARRDVDAFVLDPEYERQPEEIWQTLEYAYRTEHWCVYIDELLIVDKQMALTPAIDKLLTQGRSKGISVVVGMQRPAQVSRFALSESMHVISFALERRDAKIIGEACGDRMQRVVEDLGRYEFAWRESVSRRIWTGRLDIKTGRLVAT